MAAPRQPWLVQEEARKQQSSQGLLGTFFVPRPDTHRGEYFFCVIAEISIYMEKDSRQRAQMLAIMPRNRPRGAKRAFSEQVELSMPKVEGTTKTACREARKIKIWFR